MRHLYACPMRWADMDMLGHVNNVTYVDYLQEARIDMLSVHATRRNDDLAEGVVVVRHEVQFVAPLVLREEPVHVETWVCDVRAASFTMAYEIFDEDADGGRTVYLRATTLLTPFVFAHERPRRITGEERETLRNGSEPAALEPSPSVPPRPPGGPRHVYPLHVRWSDVDAYGHVNNVTYFEYFQEARIRYLSSLPREEDGPWSNWVVAHSDVDYRRPILFRLEPYAVESWVAEVGRKSAVLVSEVRDGEEVLARSRVVMVGFDQATQRASELNPAQRQRLVDEIPTDV